MIWDPGWKNCRSSTCRSTTKTLFTQAGKPYELDPHTLDTLGESDMGGLIKGPLGGHYRLMTDKPESGSSNSATSDCRRFITFGSEIAFGGSTVRFYELDEDGRCVAQCQHPLSDVDITFVHDMLVTENYYGLVLGPIEVRG